MSLHFANNLYKNLFFIFFPFNPNLCYGNMGAVIRKSADRFSVSGREVVTGGCYWAYRGFAFQFTKFGMYRYSVYFGEMC